MHKHNWDDLRFVLAVAESGSVSAAARALGVNHATVLRRVAAFEEQHGIMVFERTTTGYAVPSERRRIIEAAREAEAAHLAVTRLISGARAPLTGVVRLTTTDTICATILPSALVRLRQEAPELTVEVLCSNARADLGRVEADIAVRPASELPDDLTGEVASHLGFAVYGPADDPECPGWLRPVGVLERSRVVDWMRAIAGDQHVAATADSFISLCEMAAAGLGRTILPCVLGDRHPGLARTGDALPESSVPLWVASHVDLADAPRIAAVRSRLVAALKAQDDVITGQSVAA